MVDVDRRIALADLAHQQWSGWMEYLFSKCTFNEDGTAVIPAWAVTRWQRQLATPFADLPPEEQEADFSEADRVLEVLGGCG